MPYLERGTGDRDGFATGRYVNAVTGFERQEVDVVVTVQREGIDTLDR